MKESKNTQMNIRVEPSQYKTAESLCRHRPGAPKDIARNLFTLWIECCQLAGHYIDPVDLLEKPHQKALQLVADEPAEYRTKNEQTG